MEKLVVTFDVEKSCWTLAKFLEKFTITYDLQHLFDIAMITYILYQVPIGPKNLANSWNCLEKKNYM